MEKTLLMLQHECHREVSAVFSNAKIRFGFVMHPTSGTMKLAVVFTPGVFAVRTSVSVEM
jgi:hypothetical protein